MTWWAIFLAFAVTAGLTWRFCSPKSSLYLLDHPNSRSLHKQPTPRSGGVAVLAGIFAGGLLIAATQPQSTGRIAMLLTGLPLALISFLDDRFGIHAGIRFLVHVFSAAALLSLVYAPGLIILPGLGSLFPVMLEIAVALLFIVWMINLYNFMDGMDGFAAGMAIIGFTTCALIGAQTGHSLFAALAMLIVGATAGFLLFNFPPAKIFLGDTGSSVLGFLVAAFSMWASHDDIFPLALAVLIFSPFIVDATVTLLLRLIRGEKIWQAHRSHYYQRLVQLGWGHRRTVLAEYALMLACSLSALASLNISQNTQLGIVVGWLLIYTLLILGIERHERRRTRSLR